MRPASVDQINKTVSAGRVFGRKSAMRSLLRSAPCDCERAPAREDHNLNETGGRRRPETSRSHTIGSCWTWVVGTR